MRELSRERPDHEELQFAGLWAAPLLFPPVATLTYSVAAGDLGRIAFFFVLVIAIDVLGIFVPLMVAGWWCGRWSDRLTHRLQVSPYWVLAALVILVDAGVAVLPLWAFHIHELLW